MKKFVIMIDYKAEAKRMFDYIPVETNDIVDAIDIVDSFFETDVYLMHVLRVNTPWKMVFIV